MGAQDDLVSLVETALDSAASPEELYDCAVAAAAIGDARLRASVAGRIEDEVRTTAQGASAWQVEASWSKLDWTRSGRKVRVLAEAWSLVARDGEEPGSGATELEE